LSDFPTRRYSARILSISKKLVIYSWFIPMERLALSKLRWVILIYKFALRAISKLNTPLVDNFELLLRSNLYIFVFGHFLAILPNSSSYLLFKLVSERTSSSSDWHDIKSWWGFEDSKTVSKWLKGVYGETPCPKSLCERFKEIRFGFCFTPLIKCDRLSKERLLSERSTN
jgi:hypothetical protein